MTTGKKKDEIIEKAESGITLTRKEINALWNYARRIHFILIDLAVRDKSFANAEENGLPNARRRAERAVKVLHDNVLRDIERQ
jgi:hypothetical protein